MAALDPAVAALLVVAPAGPGPGEDAVEEGLVEGPADRDADADHGDGDFGAGPHNQPDGVAGVVVGGQVGHFEGAFDAAGSGAFGENEMVSSRLFRWYW